MNTNNNLATDFCIEIEFKKNSESPGRVFRTTLDLIDAFHATDIDLISSIDSKIEPTILLEDIEAGSLKTWLRYKIEEIDNAALKNLEWKPIVGDYLVKAKRFIVSFLENKTEITDRSQINEAETKLLELAQQTNIKGIPVYSPISQKDLLKNIQLISQAMSNLTPEDKMAYITKDNRTPFNLSFSFAPEKIENLLTKETIESSMPMILQVKKPDFLGESMWELKHEKTTIPAKILDEEWLESFHRREIEIHPGYSIRADVQIVTKYGYDTKVVAIRYNILKVTEIISLREQNNLFKP
jgi:hypothetical protein